MIGLYPLDLDGDVAFSVGVEADDAPTGPDAGLRALVLPGGPIASVLHTGPHEELPLAYYPLLAWVQERGLVAAGPVRERHLDDPADTAPEHLRTEVSIPVHDPGDPT